MTKSRNEQSTHLYMICPICDCWIQRLCSRAFVNLHYGDTKLDVSCQYHQKYVLLLWINLFNNLSYFYLNVLQDDNDLLAKDNFFFLELTYFNYFSLNYHIITKCYNISTFAWWEYSESGWSVTTRWWWLRLHVHWYLLFCCEKVFFDAFLPHIFYFNTWCIKNSMLFTLQYHSCAFNSFLYQLCSS